MFKDRVYLCEKCGNTLHRDINAANNILKRGLKSFGLGIINSKPFELANTS